MDVDELNTKISQYKEAAQAGDLESQIKLGECYQEKADYQHAAKWLEKAARQKGRSIPYNFGSCYLMGVGVEQDYSEAVRWFKKALDKK